MSLECINPELFVSTNRQVERRICKHFLDHDVDGYLQLIEENGTTFLIKTCEQCIVEFAAVCPDARLLARASFWTAASAQTKDLKGDGKQMLVVSEQSEMQSINFIH